MVGRGVCSYRGQIASKNHSGDLLGDPDRARSHRRTLIVCGENCHLTLAAPIGFVFLRLPPLQQSTDSNIDDTREPHVH